MTWYQRSGSKYNSRRTEYHGTIYQSKKEAQYAFDLDMLKNAGEIKDWKRQFKLDLRVNGEHIANYYVDFWVLQNDGREELHEVKSQITMTDTWRIKWRLTEVLFGDKYKLVVIK